MIRRGAEMRNFACVWIKGKKSTMATSGFLWRASVRSARAFCLVVLSAVVLSGAAASSGARRIAVPAVAERDSTADRVVPLRQTDVRPSFPGGREAFTAYVDDYFTNGGDTAGRVTPLAVKVRFIVEKDGSVSGARIVNPVTDSIDNAVLRMLAAMPRWTPGRKAGHAVRTGYGTTIYVPCSREHRLVQPQFVGGQDVLMKYVKAKLKNYEASRYKGNRVKVVARFVVQADGSVSDVEIVKHGRALMDEAVLGVLRGMPKWQPGTVDGKPVKVRYTLPVTFGNK